MKEWLTLIIVLLIVIIVFDGWRRMRNARYGNIRMSSSIKKRQKQDDLQRQPSEVPSYTSELPNGGARVVGRRDPESNSSSIDKKASAKSNERPDHSSSAEITRRPVRDPQQASLNLGESVPMLMEEIQEPKSSRASSEAQDRLVNNERGDHYTRIEPTLLDESGRDSPDDDEDDYDDAEDDEAYPSDAYEEDDYEGEDFDEEGRPYDQELKYDRNYGRDIEDHSRDDDYEYEDDRDDEDYDEPDEDYEEPQSSADTSQLQPNPDEVLIINVMAHKGSMFSGTQLLDTLLKCGLRYGDMDIFHRYSDGKGEGVLLFSMANMVKPGVFDLDAMDEFETPGVSLFMTLPLKADSMQSFELMLDTAKTLAESLNGELKDEQRSVMTRQTIEHCRQRILDFERRRLFQRPR